MGLHADVRIVVAGQRGGQQDERRVQARGLVSLPDELPADPLTLILPVDGEVGQVSAEGEVGDRARCPPVGPRAGP